MNPHAAGGMSEKRGPPPPKRNFLARFWSEEIVHPEKLPGNIGIAFATGVAGIAVLLIRTVGKDLLVPQH